MKLCAAVLFKDRIKLKKFDKLQSDVEIKVRKMLQNIFCLNRKILHEKITMENADIRNDSLLTSQLTLFFSNTSFQLPQFLKIKSQQ